MAGRKPLEPGEIGEPWFPAKQPYPGEHYAKVRYRSHRGEVKEATGRGASARQAKSRAVRNAETKLSVRTGGLIAGTSTVQELADAWLTSKSTTAAKGKGGRPISPGTRRTYSSTLRNQVVPALGATLEIRHLENPARVAAALAAIGAKGSAKQAFEVMGQMLRWAHRMGALERNPMEVQERQAVERREVRILADEQVPALISALETAALPNPRGGRPPNRDLLEECLLCLATGLRHGEIHGLWWGSVNLDAEIPTVTVEATLVEPGAGGYDILTRQAWGKSHHAYRVLPLVPEVADVLRERRKRTRFRRLSDPVFANSTGGYLWMANLRTRLTKALHKHAPADLHGVTMHTLRRTVGTKIAWRYGSDYARWWLGHGSTKVTEEYYIARPSQAPDAREALGDLFKGA